MATTAATSVRAMPFLAGALAGCALIAAGYLRVASVPIAPGDWLFRVRDSQGAPGWWAPGALFAWCVEATSLWSQAPGWQRAVGFLGACLGVLGATLVLWRLPRPNALGVVATLTALALLPWARDDASELCSAGRAFAPLLAMLPLFVRGPRRSALAALVLGALAGSLSGPALLAGEAVLACGLAWALGRRGWAALVPAIAFLAASFVLAGACARAPTIPDSALWWQDLGLQSPLPAAPWLETGLLACIAMIWLVPAAGASLAGLAVLVVALGVAGLGMSRLLARQSALVRDLDSFGRDTEATLYINLPGHVRGYALGLLVTGAERQAKKVLATIDTGAQLDIPIGRGWPPGEWTPSPSWDGPRVRRWTARGFVTETWRDCLETEPLPLVVAARDVAGLSGPLAIFERGRLAPLAGWTAVPLAAGGVRLTGSAAQAITLAVALLPVQRVQTFADVKFVGGSLRPSWFAPPWPAVRLDGPDAARLRHVGWAPGFGPLLEVAPGAEPVECTIAIDPRGS